MTEIEMTEIKMINEILKPLIIQYGLLINNAYRSSENIAFSRKQNSGDPFSDIEITIEREIYKALCEFSNLGFIFEECKGLNRKGEMMTLFCDPIDGSAYFVNQRGGGLFTISVGIESASGELLSGLIYNPVTDEMIEGSIEHPTTFNGKIQQVSPCSSLRDAIIGLDLIHTGKDSLDSWIATSLLPSIYQASKRIRVYGVGAFSLSLLSCGYLSAYIDTHGHTVKPYDVKAGFALVKFSQGGCIKDIFSQSGDKITLAGNQSIVNKLASLLVSFESASFSTEKKETAQKNPNPGLSLHCSWASAGDDGNYDYSSDRDDDPPQSVEEWDPL